MSEHSQLDIQITATLDFEVATRLVRRLSELALPNSVIVKPPAAPERETSTPRAQSEDLPHHSINPQQPYDLSGIASGDQYLSEEHAAEFWPDYRRAMQRGGNRVPDKYDCLNGALPSVLHPQRRSQRIHSATEADRQEYGHELGLVLITPRSRVGFGDDRRPPAYAQTERIPTVIQVASFLDYEREIRDAKTEELPWGLTARRRRFLQALASRLVTQLLPRSQP